MYVGGLAEVASQEASYGGDRHGFLVRLHAEKRIELHAAMTSPVATTKRTYSHFVSPLSAHKPGSPESAARLSMVRASVFTH